MSTVHRTSTSKSRKPRGGKSKAIAKEMESKRAKAKPPVPEYGFPLIPLRVFAEKLYQGTFDDKRHICVEENEIKHYRDGKYSSLGPVPAGLDVYEVCLDAVETEWCCWWIGPKEKIAKLRHYAELASDANIEVLRLLESF